MDELITGDPVKALTGDDRQWLIERGWRDTSGDYPTIGTERA